MHKWIMAVVVAVACAFGVYLMGNDLPAKPKDESSELKPGQQLLKITATNFEFDQKEYHVKAGTDYLIKFSNKLGRHGAEIKDLGIDLNGDKPTLEFKFDKPGKYEMHCSVMCGQGHANMKATLIVE
jgi:cytochrome c oxidase subunit 2